MTTRQARTRVLWSSADLREATGGAVDKTFDAAGISIDTRTIRPGDLFIALVGENGDGHDHAAAAIGAGAAGVMVHRTVAGVSPCILVDDTLAGLTRLGGFARARFSGRVAAVTGSVGKTTVKEMSRQILSSFAPTHAATASHNNHWGVPLTLARIPWDAVYCILEIGTNHAGEIAPLAQLSEPHVAVITTIEAAHIGHFDGLDAIADEKAAIMCGLDATGIAVLPADSPWYPRLRARAGTRTVLSFGTASTAEARLLDIETGPDFTSFRADIAGREVRVRLSAPGRHMAMNGLAALTAAAALGLDLVAAANALSGFSPVAGRGVHRSLEVAGGAALLLDESYNANGASMRAALEVLRLQPSLRKVAVLGDMLELGEAGPNEHAALADDVIRSADIVFTCGPLMRHLFDALPARIQGAHAADAEALAVIVAAFAAGGDAILVKGSLGSRMRTIVAALDTGPPAGRNRIS